MRDVLRGNTVKSPNSSSLKKLFNKIFSKAVLRGIVAIVFSIAFWETASRFAFPLFAFVPPPSIVLSVVGESFGSLVFWENWTSSFGRVIFGFVIAQIIGIPLGLLMANNRNIHGMTFPIFEILRPIPPLAWVPASIIFWPTTELSIAFVIFLGAFFTIVINVLGGAKSIDARYIRAARSLGSNRSDMFFRIILPAVLPSIFTGMAVGMGITWEVVVAAEMIAGKSGLGYYTWESYVGGNFPRIIVGMISIGLAGYISSSMIRLIGKRSTPWLRLF